MKLGSNRNCPRPSPSKPNPHKKKGKSRTARALQKAAGHVSHKKKHHNNEPSVPWSCDFSVEGRPVDEDDLVIKGNEARARGGQVAYVVGKAFLLPRDMRIRQGDSSECLIEILKCDSVLVSFQMLFIPRHLVFFLFF